ncbi:MAG: hypothetical protein V3T43_02750 [Nitrosomonadaceae bacterium]
MSKPHHYKKVKPLEACTNCVHRIPYYENGFRAKCGKHTFEFVQMDLLHPEEHVCDSYEVKEKK